MGLLTPFALLMGLTLPVIALLWLLKRRRTEHEVSSTYLWRQVLHDVRANAPWQRLVAKLLMILQLAAAALFTLALARPHVLGAAAGQTHLIVVLDTSGSMRMAEGTATRFDLAREQAVSRIQSLDSRDHVTLITAGVVPLVVASAVPPADAQARVTGAEPTHGMTDWPQALSLAASAGRAEPGARVLIVTDATVGEAGLTRLGIPAEAIQVGSPAENLSIHLTVRPASTGRSAAALGRVTNHGQKQASAGIELLADGGRVDDRRVDVPAGGTTEVVWQDLPAGAVLLTARISETDALAADNAAHAVIQQVGKNRALLVSKASLFLGQALLLRDDVELVRTTPENYSPGSYQLYVFDGWIPDVLPPGALLLAAPPPENPVMRLGAPGPVTSVAAAPRSGALTAYVQLEDVHIAQARPVEVPQWANPLLEAPEGVLVAAGHREGRPVAVMGFDIHESDFPLRIGFPVFMQNLLNWLVPARPSAIRVASGEPLPLTLDPLALSATVTTPDGRKTAVAPPFPAAPWTDTAVPGVYTLVQPLPQGERTSFFVVEFPEAESGNGGIVALSEGPAETAGPAASSPQELWPWLAGLALLILGLEWWVYIHGI